MPYLPADLASMQTAIQGWLEDELVRFDPDRWAEPFEDPPPDPLPPRVARSDAVIRKDQDAANPVGPDYPYAAWKLGSPVRIGRSVVETLETGPDEAAERIEHDANLTLSIEIFERADADEPTRSAHGAALHVEASTHSPTVRTAISAAGLAFVQTLSVGDLARLAGARFESRYLVEILVRARVRLERGEVDYIEDTGPTMTIELGNVTGEVGA